ncbi:MAG TPA: MFS transporter [Candidatus Acidoferrales bacterium]|nr:MFS transporter [Candidatus Acidoferrales bacterium]
MRAPAVLRPLAHRDFALLWSGQTFSTVGNFVMQVALPWQVLQLTGSAVQVGVVVAMNIAANVVFVLFGGVLVDRVPRRRVILVSDFASGAVTSVIAILSATGSLRIEHLYVAGALAGATGAFFLPAVTAILPELVPPDVLVAGNALRAFSRQGGRLTGPVLGGLFIAIGGPALAFGFDAITFFVSFLALVAMSPARGLMSARRGFLSELREGVDFVFSLPWIWVTIALFGVMNTFLIGANAVGIPVLLREVLAVGPTTFGLVYASQAIGEIAGGLVVGQMRVRRTGIIMYAFAALGGLAMFLLATEQLGAIVASAIVWGLSLVGFGVLWETALQRHDPRELMGRVSSVDWFGSIALGPLGPLMAAALVATLGPAPLFVAAGIVNLVGCAVALLVPSIRRLE